MIDGGMQALQFSLVRDDTKSKTLQQIPREKLVISPFNPRRNRSEGDIGKLAQRIERNGFEITRALWAYPVNAHYEVFAGGNRLEAVKRTSIDALPVVVFEGFTDDEITGLADQDNENDEYHAPVSIVDVWADYKRLRDAGWEQERIATAKGVDQAQVARRLAYAAFPQAVTREFMKNDSLKESYAGEINRLCNFHNPPWLTRDDLMLEIVTTVVKDNGKNVTAKDFAKAVSAANELVKYAAGVADSFGEVTFYDGDNSYRWDARSHFIAGCANTQARTLAAVKAAEYKTRQQISENAKEHAEYIAKKAKDAEAATAAAKPLEVLPGQWWKLGNHRLYCGDTSSPEFYTKVPSAAFAFADPPYNANAAEWDNAFAWKHDWLISKTPVVAVTPGISSIFDFAQTTKMPYVWSMSCWIANGMTRGALGFGNWIYIALFANGSIHRSTQDFIKVTIQTEQTDDTSHKGRKPEQLMISLVETFAKAGEMVIDPFLGSGSTLFACEQTGRACVGGEMNPQFCKEIIERWQGETGNKAEVF
jgi:16S rRNA G966 N2-methylase RsmD